jgi:hypothetical protein
MLKSDANGGYKDERRSLPRIGEYCFSLHEPGEESHEKGHHHVQARLLPHGASVFGESDPDGATYE